MKIILKEDIVNLGYKNDVVEVKNGYGRNYLIPQGKATLATPSALKMLAENLRQQAHKIAKLKADAEAKAATFDGVALTIPVKVSPTGTIYGSVGAVQIAKALEEAGHPVDHRYVTVENVKVPGKYTASLQLHKEVAVQIPFEVTAENAAELAAEKAARKAEEAAHQAALAAAAAEAEAAENGEETPAEESTTAAE